jgi:hypothetical protein
VEADPLLHDLFLHFAREAVPDFVRSVLAIDEEVGALAGEVEHVVAG